MNLKPYAVFVRGRAAVKNAILNVEVLSPFWQQKLDDILKAVGIAESGIQSDDNLSLTPILVNDGLKVQLMYTDGFKPNPKDTSLLGHAGRLMVFRSVNVCASRVLYSNDVWNCGEVPKEIMKYIPRNYTFKDISMPQYSRAVAELRLTNINNNLHHSRFREACEKVGVADMLAESQASAYSRKIAVEAAADHTIKDALTFFDCESEFMDTLRANANKLRDALVAYEQSVNADTEDTLWYRGVCNAVDGVLGTETSSSTELIQFRQAINGSCALIWPLGSGYRTFPIPSNNYESKEFSMGEEYLNHSIGECQRTFWYGSRNADLRRDYLRFVIEVIERIQVNLNAE